MQRAVASASRSSWLAIYLQLSQPLKGVNRSLGIQETQNDTRYTHRSAHSWQMSHTELILYAYQRNCPRSWITRERAQIVEGRTVKLLIKLDLSTQAAGLRLVDLHVVRAECIQTEHRPRHGSSEVSDFFGPANSDRVPLKSSMGSLGTQRIILLVSSRMVDRR